MSSANSLNMPMISGVFDARRTRIDRAQRAEERAVGQNDRHRDIALEPVSCRRVMAAIDGVLGDIVDDNRLPTADGSRCRSWFRLRARRRASGRTAISSFTLHAIHRSSVTRATAANPMPVVRQTTSRIKGTAAILLTAAISRSKSRVVSVLVNEPPFMTPARVNAGRASRWRYDRHSPVWRILPWSAMNTPRGAAPPPTRKG